MTKQLLTAVVITKNEEHNLDRCLNSLAWVDKVIVVDDYSTDRTVVIAKQYKAAVVRHRLVNFYSQRNYALSKVETPWVLFVDADEEVTPELAREMRQAINTGKFDGFSFPRKNIVFGKWLQHSRWYPDRQMHLFRTAKGKYYRDVHEEIRLNGKVGELTHCLLHHNFQSVSQYLDKLSFYTSLEAQHQIDRGYQFSWSDLIKKPVDEFLSRFFFGYGYKDSLHGLVLALLQAFSELIVYIKIWENEKFVDQDISAFPHLFDSKINDVYFWLAQSSNLREKIRLKIKRKI